MNVIWFIKIGLVSYTPCAQDHENGSLLWGGGEGGCLVWDVDVTHTVACARILLCECMNTIINTRMHSFFKFTILPVSSWKHESCTDCVIIVGSCCVFLLVYWGLAHTVAIITLPTSWLCIHNHFWDRNLKKKTCTSQVEWASWSLDSEVEPASPVWWLEG